MIKNKILLLKTLAATAFIVVVALVFLRDLNPPPTENTFGVVNPDDLKGAELTDQDDQPFNPQTMVGKPWVVYFFFTSCPGPCPLMTQKVAYLLSKDPALHALAITTDPATDTPEVMRAYGAKFKADFKRWTFVRGEAGAIREFSERTLKLPLGELPDSHSQRIARINAKGEILEWINMD